MSQWNLQRQCTVPQPQKQWSHTVLFHWRWADSVELKSMISENTLSFLFFSIHEISFIIFIIFCCYSITVVSIFRPLPSSTHPSPCSHSQSPHCCPCPWASPTCSLSSPSPSFHHFPPFPFPSGHCQSVPCFRACGSIVLVSLFCSLDSSYRWDHTVFVFHRLSFRFGKSYSS